MRYGLSEQTIEKICGVFANHPTIDKAVLYGSRAKGNFKPGSDIDLSLHGAGISSKELGEIDSELDDLLLPYTIDLLVFDTLSHVKLREHIERVGKVFYQRSSAEAAVKKTDHENYGKDENDGESRSQILPPRGDYQTLLSYQKSEVVYQITYRFCERFLKKGDRTIDQMVQAARSGKQNIVEGSKAATTSKEMEIKLTNVARASLEELLEDYRDFLKVRDLPIWDKESSEARYARKLGMTTPLTFELFRKYTETRPAEIVANIAICLIHQANYLLDQQLKALEKSFLKDGGLRERMTRARLQARDQQKKGQWKE